MKDADLSSMSDVRAAIDELDRALVARLAERAGAMARAAELGASSAEFAGPSHAAALRMRQAAEAAGFDPERAERIFRSMTAGSEEAPLAR